MRFKIKNFYSLFIIWIILNSCNNENKQIYNKEKQQNRTQLIVNHRKQQLLKKFLILSDSFQNKINSIYLYENIDNDKELKLTLDSLQLLKDISDNFDYQRGILAIIIGQQLYKMNRNCYCNVFEFPDTNWKSTYWIMMSNFKSKLINFEFEGQKNWQKYGFIPANYLIKCISENNRFKKDSILNNLFSEYRLLDK